MSLLQGRSKVCMAPIHVRSKVCIAPIHVQSKFVHFAPCMEKSNADFAPHMEWRHSFRVQKITQIAISAKFLLKKSSKSNI